MTTKQEKLRQREEKIISAASAIIIENGFFNLRMSDLAAKSEISVGTLYVHFESKEDLLMGIAIDAIRKRFYFFKLAESKYHNYVEKLSAILISDHMVNEKTGEISEIERLAQFPSVWKRSSYRRMEEMNQLCQKIGDFVRSNIEKALAAGELTAENDKAESIATCINASAWGVCVGMHHVFNSYCVDKDEEILKSNDIMHAYVEAVHALLTGFGCRQKDFKERLYHIFDDLKQEAVSFSTEAHLEEVK